MGLILSLTFFICAYFAYASNGKKINHSSIFSLVWAVILLFDSMHLYGIFTSSDFTYFVIASGVISFVLGSLAFRRVLLKSKNSPTGMDFTIHLFWLYAFFVITIALLAYPALLNITAIRNGNTDFAKIRSEFSNMYSNTALTLLYNYIALPFSMACLPITAVLVFSRCSHKTKVSVFIMAVLILIEKIYVDAGRGMVLYFVAMIFFAFKLKTGNIILFKNDRKIKRLIFLLIVLSIIVYVLISIARSGSLESFGRQIYTYLCGCVPFLDSNIKRFDNSGQYLYGAGGLHGIYQFVFTMLDNLKIVSYPKFFAYSDAMYNATLQRVEIGNGQYFNAYATAFYNVYIDGGIIAVIIEMFLYGGLARCVYNQMNYERDNYRIRTIYIFILYGITFSFIRFQFSLSRNIIAIAFISLVFKKVKKRDSIDEGSANKYGIL